MIVCFQIRIKSHVIPSSECDEEPARLEILTAGISVVPAGLGHMSRLPSAYALGCILAPLRGYVHHHA